MFCFVKLKKPQKSKKQWHAPQSPSMENMCRSNIQDTMSHNLDEINDICHIIRSFAAIAFLLLL